MPKANCSVYQQVCKASILAIMHNNTLAGLGVEVFDEGLVELMVRSLKLRPV